MRSYLSCSYFLRLFRWYFHFMFGPQIPIFSSSCSRLALFCLKHHFHVKNQKKNYPQHFHDFFVHFSSTLISKKSNCCMKISSNVLLKKSSFGGLSMLVKYWVANLSDYVLKLVISIKFMKNSFVYSASQAVNQLRHY